MKYPVYSYRDRLVGFGTPVLDQSDASAIRGFAYAVSNREGIMNFSPADYELYKCGEFDTDTGRLIPKDIPELVCTGLNAMEMK